MVPNGEIDVAKVSESGAVSDAEDPVRSALINAHYNVSVHIALVVDYFDIVVPTAPVFHSCNGHPYSVTCECGGVHGGGVGHDVNVRVPKPPSHCDL